MTAIITRIDVKIIFPGCTLVPSVTGREKSKIYIGIQCLVLSVKHEPFNREGLKNNLTVKVKKPLCKIFENPPYVVEIHKCIDKMST